MSETITHSNLKHLLEYFIECRDQHEKYEVEELAKPPQERVYIRSSEAFVEAIASALTLMEKRQEPSEVFHGMLDSATERCHRLKAEFIQAQNTGGETDALEKAHNHSREVISKMMFFSYHYISAETKEKMNNAIFDIHFLYPL